MSLYAAIDLHSTNNVLAIIDQSDQLIRSKRLPNELPQVLQELAPYREQLAGVAVESTYNWYWLVDGLIDHGFPAQLVHASAVPQYAGLKHANDQSDARHLARLMRLGILPQGYIYPREQRSIRDLLRRRAHMVRLQVSVMLSILSAWSRHTGQALSMHRFLKLTPAQLEQGLTRKRGQSEFPFGAIIHSGLFRWPLLRGYIFPLRSPARRQRKKGSGKPDPFRSLGVDQRVVVEGQVTNIDQAPMAYDGDALVVVTSAARGAITVHLPARRNLRKAQGLDLLDALKIGDRVRVEGLATGTGDLRVCQDPADRLQRID